MTMTKIKQTSETASTNGDASPGRKTRTTRKSLANENQNGRAKITETPSSDAQGMHLICSQDLLNDALLFVKSAVPTRPLHPVLVNALVSADTEMQQVTLTVSDMVLTMSASFEAQVESSGEITLPAEVLMNVVSKCPSGNLTIASTTSPLPVARSKEKRKAAETATFHYRATIADTQGGSVEIRGMDAGEFPSLTTVKGKLTSLPAKVIKTGLKGVLFAASTDETKKILTGMQWSFDPRQNLLNCTATDGHQVALISLSTEGIGRKRRSRETQPIASRCIIPVKALKELTRALEKVEPDQPLQFAYDELATRVLFEVSDGDIHKQIICQCLEDIYPDCQTLVNQYQYPKQITVNKGELLVKLDRLSVLADKKENSVRFYFDRPHQEIHLSIERDYGKGKQVVSAEVPADADQLEITFNVNYLLNAIRAISSSAVCITLNKPYTPVNLKPAGDVDIPGINMDATYFVLPQYDKEDAAKAMQPETVQSAQSDR